jgi:hypothetical protein
MSVTDNSLIQECNTTTIKEWLEDHPKVSDEYIQLLGVVLVETSKAKQEITHTMLDLFHTAYKTGLYDGYAKCIYEHDVEV